MRLVFTLGAALLAAAAVPVAANIGTLTFSGTVYNINGTPVTPIPHGVVGSVTLSDGSDPDGPPATPDGFTGEVIFGDFPGMDPGNASFVYGTPLFGGDSTDMNPYHYADLTLRHGGLVGLYLYTDGDGDTFTLTSTGFDHTTFDEDGNVRDDEYGLYRLDVPGVPEPATWAMLVTGFGLVGAGLRRRRAHLA